MSDHSTLLDDTQTASAIATFIGARPGHKVVGLHDNVMVQDRRVATVDLHTPDGYWSGSRMSATLSAPYPTVEVILVTPSGRVYGEHHKVTLDEFLDLAGVTSEQKAS